MPVICLVIIALIQVITAQSLDIAEATKTARIALSSYCGNSRVNGSWNCYWCKTVPGFRFIGSWNNANTHIFGFTGILNNVIYVAWRGTVLTDIKNWVNNFKFNQVPYKGVSGAAVHEGFYSEYLSTRNASLDAVRRALAACPKCSVTVTGHSLGGALSVLSALDVTSIAIGRAVSLTALSSPRLGNVAFKNYVERIITASRRWRVVNGADVVPHVPPRLFGYEHIGNEAWLRAGKWNFCSTGESLSCSDQLAPLFDPLSHTSILGLNVMDGLNGGCLADVNNRRRLVDED